MKRGKLVVPDAEWRQLLCNAYAEVCALRVTALYLEQQLPEQASAALLRAELALRTCIESALPIVNPGS